MEQREKEIQLIVGLFLEDYVTMDNSGPYQSEVLYCQHCRSNKIDLDEPYSKIEHALDCPVLVAKDLSTT